MNISKLREGSKIKTLVDVFELGDTYYIPAGTITTVVTSSSFHNGNTLDKDGHLWIRGVNGKRVCAFEASEISTSVQVLKY